MTRAMKLASPGVAALEDLARQARAHIVRTIASAHGGHLGGPLSVIDVLIALYFQLLRIRPQEPDWPDRDRLVLSKGHSSIALYTALAMRGYFPITELTTFDAIDSRLQGHPDMTLTPGVDMSSGSLGLGFSGALGIALGARAAKRDFTTYAILGDGECNEGIVWEAAHVAPRHGIDNLIAIVDHNKLQQFGWRGDGPTHRLPPYTGTQLVDRWAAFGWRVLEMNGHDMGEIISTLEAAKATKGLPVVIISHTIKGKGVSFMENAFQWHSKVPTPEQLATALAELGANGGAS